MSDLVGNYSVCLVDFGLNVPPTSNVIQRRNRIKVTNLPDNVGILKFFSVSVENLRQTKRLRCGRLKA